MHDVQLPSCRRFQIRLRRTRHSFTLHQPESPLEIRRVELAVRHRCLNQETRHETQCAGWLSLFDFMVRASRASFISVFLTCSIRLPERQPATALLQVFSLVLFLSRFVVRLTGP